MFTFIIASNIRYMLESKGTNNTSLVACKDTLSNNNCNSLQNFTTL